MSSRRNPVRSKKKRRARAAKRILAVAICAVFVGLVGTLGWFVVRGITQAVATGDKPVSGSSSALSEPTEPPTEPAPTFPTIAVDAPTTSPRLLLFDLTHDTLLYEKDADVKFYPASLTKILTAIIATEQCTPDEVFTVGSELGLVQPLSSLAYLKEGYQLKRDVILDALLLPSGNDAAYTIAVHVGRKVGGETLSDLEAARGFCDLMNQKARELGAVNSHFSNPDGFFSGDHYTTANDMLLIAKAALEYENLRTIFAKTTATDTLESGAQVTWNNSNALLNPNSPYYFEGATGMKTGFTDEAGQCVIASANRAGKQMIAIVMGGLSGESRWADALALLNAGYAAEMTHQ